MLVSIGMNGGMRLSGGARFLVVSASIVIVIAGLRAASTIFLPFLASLFMSLFSLPLLYWLKRLKLPNGLAVLGTMLVVIAILLGIGLLVGGSFNAFTEAAPVYRARLQEMTLSFRDWLSGKGIDLSGLLAAEQIDAGIVMDLARNLLRAVTVVLSQTATVILTMTFILLEAAGFPAKLMAAFGERGGGLGRFTKVQREVQRYLVIKTCTSLATGILISGWLMGLGIDFPLVWGLLAFLLNFIPTVGSFMAAIPPILLAMVQFGPGRAVVVTIGYVVVNMILGGMVEPHLMGRRLGLSTLVVFLSLVFWGWVWGPVGMLLSVPLTTILKIMLENTDDLRWVAMLLDASPPRSEAPAKAATGD